MAKLWPDETVVCIASGPSLTAEDVDFVRGRARVIAVNDAMQLAPWADVLYSSDESWWKRQRGAADFQGLKYTIATTVMGRLPASWPGVVVLRNTGMTGLERDPFGLKTYQNSGGAAINLAVHLGATRIILIGYDLSVGEKGKHHFYDEPKRMASPYREFRKSMDTMVGPLRELKIDVINASRHTLLTAFPRKPLAEALAIEVAA